jgi:hypothetical protein
MQSTIMGQHECRLRPVSMEAPAIHLAVSNQTSPGRFSITAHYSAKKTPAPLSKSEENRGPPLRLLLKTVKRGGTSRSVASGHDEI